MARVSLLVAVLAGIVRVSAVNTFLGASMDSTMRSLQALSVGVRDDDGGYHYMPEEKALICICAKCGSTSLYEFIYKKAFQKKWNYTGVPYIHDVISPRWEGKFKVLNSEEARGVINNDKVFSFALMRDPKARIISSWKSKAACDGTGDWGTDRRDRDRMVPHLLRLAGLPVTNCLGFEDFVKAIALVHRKGQQSMLNVHFRPQQEVCFREFAPKRWTKVGAINDTKAAQMLGKHLGASEVSGFPQYHSSKSSAHVEMTPKSERLLHEITRKEYAVLATRVD